MTTPNRWFPLDPHTLLPFAHWLPAGPRRDRLFRARGFDDVLDPLGPAELAALFPYPVTVVNQGLTLVAHRARRAGRRRRPVKRPVWILHVLVVGLALHNLVMAELWAAGVRGTALDVVSAWKEALLALALAARPASARAPALRRLPADWLALAFGALRRRSTRCLPQSCARRRRDAPRRAARPAPRSGCRSPRTSSGAASS